MRAHRNTKEHWCLKAEVHDSIGNSCVWLNFNLNRENKIHHHSQKEHTKISETAKFGHEMLKNAKKYSLILQILSTFVLRTEICTNFGLEMYTKLANFARLLYVFRIFQHFATKFGNFTIFAMLFSVVMDFVF